MKKDNSYYNFVLWICSHFLRIGASKNGKKSGI